MDALANVLLVAALLIIAWATLAPRGPAAVSEAPRLCIWCGASRVTDAIANVALFMPLGMALVLRGRRVPAALITGAVLSLHIEAAQFAGLPPGRVASLADLLTNTAGAGLGAWLTWRRDDVLFPTARMAKRLALAWCAGAATILLVTAWATSAPPPMTRWPIAAPRLSALPFTPGYGWFAGVVTRTVVNGTEVAHAGTGPVIVVAPPADRVAADIDVTGRDTRREPVPMLYVHQPGDTMPVLLIAQRGDVSVLRVDSRGARAGLAALEIDAQFTGGHAAASLSNSRHLSGRVTSRAFTLQVTDGVLRAQTTLARTATTGWAFAQSLVSLSSGWRTALTALWLAVLLLPVGYWGWRSGPVRAYVVLGGALVLSIALVAGVQLFAISYPPLREWLAMAGALGAGMLLGMLFGMLSPAFDSTRSARATPSPLVRHSLVTDD